MGKFLIAKVIYAIVLSAALFVSAALIEVGGEMGYLFVFFLQGLLFIGLFVCRKSLIAPTMSRRDYGKSESSVKSFATGAATGALAVAAAPVAAAGAAGAAGKARIDSIQKQRHADKPSDTPKSAPVANQADAYKPGTKTPDSSSPPATAGREYSPAPPVEEPASTSGTVATMPPPIAEEQRNGDPVPVKSFREDYEQARADREPQPYGEQRKAPAVDPLTHGKPPRNDPAPIAPLAEQIKQERAKTPSQ
jgi:hypothetical protein